MRGGGGGGGEVGGGLRGEMGFRECDSIFVSAIM